MKVYYINARYDGCYYVRCYLPLYHNGWDGNKTSLYTPQVSNAQTFKGAMASDIIVFHRPDQVEKAQVIPLLQLQGKKVVVDNDDTYSPDSGTPAAMFYGDKVERLNEILAESIRHANMVTVSTEFLKKEYEQYNDNVIVLPNFVDPDDWGTPLKNKTNKLRIGLIGSVAITRDYEVIKPLLKKLSKDKNVQLVVFGLPDDKPELAEVNKIYKDEKEFWNSLNIEWQPFVPMHDYFETLRNLRLDVALIPRENNYFNKCKSDLKFLEMSMLKVPCIVSSFKDSPYEKHEGYLLKAKNKLQWEEQLAKIKDKKFREQLGAKAYKYVKKNYDIKNNAHLWVDAYKTLYENNNDSR